MQVGNSSAENAERDEEHGAAATAPESNPLKKVTVDDEAPAERFVSEILEVFSPGNPRRGLAIVVGGLIFSMCVGLWAIGTFSAPNQTISAIAVDVRAPSGKHSTATKLDGHGYVLGQGRLDQHADPESSTPTHEDAADHQDGPEHEDGTEAGQETPDEGSAKKMGDDDEFQKGAYADVEAENQTPATSGGQTAGSDEKDGAGNDENEEPGHEEKEEPGHDEKEEAGNDEKEGAGSEEKEGAGNDEKERAGSDEKEEAGNDEKEGAGSDEKEGAGNDEKERAGSDEKEEAGSDEKDGAGNHENEEPGHEEKEEPGHDEKEEAGNDEKENNGG